MNEKVKQIKVGVHPVSHKFEWESRGKWGGSFARSPRYRLEVPALRIDRI